jgi:hypothetical protein
VTGITLSRSGSNCGKLLGLAERAVRGKGDQPSAARGLRRCRGYHQRRGQCRFCAPGCRTVGRFRRWHDVGDRFVRCCRLVHEIVLPCSLHQLLLTVRSPAPRAAPQTPTPGSMTLHHG